MEAVAGCGRGPSEPHPRAGNQPQIVAAAPSDSAGCAKREGRWPASIAIPVRPPLHARSIGAAANRPASPR